MPTPNSSTETRNQTLHSSLEYFFPSCEPIQEIWENFYLGKTTRYMMYIIITNGP